MTCGLPVMTCRSRLIQGAAMWQASNQGTVNGINGNVDINFTCIRIMSSRAFRAIPLAD